MQFGSTRAVCNTGHCEQKEREPTHLGWHNTNNNAHLVIHMFWKVDREDRMEPPIHTRYLRSGGATTRTFTAEPPRAVTSLNSLCE